MREVLERVMAAELPAATERVAWRLLALSVEQGGARHVALAWDEYAALCGRANRVAARRHLTALAKAGFLRYSTSKDGSGTVWLHVIWLGVGVGQDTAQAELGTMVSGVGDSGEQDTEMVSPAGESSEQDTEMVSPAGEGSEQDTETVSAKGKVRGQDTEKVSSGVGGGLQDTGLVSLAVGSRYRKGMREDTESVSSGYRNGSVTTSSPHTRDGGGGSIQPPSSGETITTTNHPPGIRTRLRSLGLKPEAVAIDATLSVHEVAAILDAWEQDVRRGEVGTGALIYRLRNGITPPDVSRLREKDYKPAEFADVILG